MRSSVSISLLSLLLSPLVAAAEPRDCLRSKAKDLAVQSLCGDKQHVLSCFEKASNDDLEASIVSCLTKAGCTKKAASSEASYLVTLCDGEPNELKKREREALVARASTDSTDSTTTTDTSSTTTTTSAVTKRTTGDTTATSTTATATTGATTATSVTATTGTACSTISTTTVSACDATNQYDCSMIQTTTSVCVSGWYCTQDAAGNHLCMVRQDGMTLSGSIVAVFLAVVLTGIIASIVFLCCRDRKEQKRIRARSEAAAIAKANAVQRPETRNVSQSAPHASDDAPQPNPFAG